jgi:hypothetical protein
MRSVSSLFGIVKPPKGIKAATLQELKDARADHVAEKYARVLRESRAAGAGKPKR